MTELLSILVASLLVGIGVSNPKTTPPENTERTKMQATLDFKHAENRADAEYKLAIVNCKRKPRLDKMRCLDDAKNVNAKLIVAAREKMESLLP